MSELRDVTIYTDGACSGNPGPGGFGIVMIHGEKRREMSAGYRRTTNNRMELLAAIIGLESLRYPCRVTIFTDSQYLVNGIDKGWAKSWRAKGWRKADGKPAINVDLWERLLALLETHTVKMSWVRGHAENAENNRCDELAVAASRLPDLPPDENYRG